ncbi:hypothetical protein ABPG75_001345 [Micractinium tetrahymenae]
MQDAPRCSRTGARLLKHTVTPEVAAAAVAALGPNQLEAGKAIIELRQPRLRQVFQQVYSVATDSGNNGELGGLRGAPLDWPGRAATGA